MESFSFKLVDLFAKGKNRKLLEIFEVSRIMIGVNFRKISLIWRSRVDLRGEVESGVIS